jgi:hypothetical protein
MWYRDCFILVSRERRNKNVSHFELCCYYLSNFCFTLFLFVTFKDFTPNKWANIFSGDLSLQNSVKTRYFGDLLCLHHQGRYGGVDTEGGDRDSC